MRPLIEFFYSPLIPALFCNSETGMDIIRPMGPLPLYVITFSITDSCGTVNALEYFG